MARNGELTAGACGRTRLSEAHRSGRQQAKLPSGNDFLRYFDLRKRWEAGQRIVASEVVQLNVSRKQFAEKTTTALYSNGPRASLGTKK